jgi:hypothetical protein
MQATLSQIVIENAQRKPGRKPRSEAKDENQLDLFQKG